MPSKDTALRVMHETRGTCDVFHDVFQAAAGSVVVWLHGNLLMLKGCTRVCTWARRVLVRARLNQRYPVPRTIERMDGVPKARESEGE